MTCLVRKKSEISHKNLSRVINKSDIDKVFIKGVKTLITYKNINKTKRKMYSNEKKMWILL